MLPTSIDGVDHGEFDQGSVSGCRGRRARCGVLLVYGADFQLATIGQRTGVAMVFGIKFSGFVARAFRRVIYLMKLPRLPKKLRVLVGWTLDLLFARDIEQMITLRDVEAAGQLAGRILARAAQQSSMIAPSTPEAAIRDQP